MLLKMKKKLKISTLIFGIIVAVVALTNSSSFAENVANNEVTQVKTYEADIQEVMENIFDKNDFQLNENKCTKIYNSKNQLVYECRDKDDARLKTLLRRCDLVLQTDSSSYYLLGD